MLNKPTQYQYQTLSSGKGLISNENFSNINLKDVYFCCQHFTNCNFKNSQLPDSLEGTVFENCNLKGTCLDPEATVPYPSKRTLREHGFSVKDGIVYGYRSSCSRFIGSHKYDMGEHVASHFSVDKKSDCHPGIYLASKEWLIENYGKYIDVVTCFCFQTEMIQAGDKFRAERIFVTSEPFSLKDE